MTDPQGSIYDIFGGRQRTLVIVIVAILVSGIGIGGVAFALFGDHGSPVTPQAAIPQQSRPGTASTDTVTETTVATPTRCQAAPQASVTNVDLTNRGLEMKTEFSTSCNDGDTLTGSSVVLAAAQGTRDFGSGVFDLDSNPIVIPASGKVDRTLVYPAGTYWRIPQLIQSGAMDVTVSDATQSGEANSASSGSSTLIADHGANPGHGSLEGTAEHALKELADYDRGVVTANLQNYWVPQISSKKLGIYADGITYTNNDILRNHLSLRQRYDNVRLVWSADWTTFNDPSFWVTIVGQPYYDGPSANQWCDAHNIDAGNCFAKVISSTAGTEGTTMLRN